ncbi:MAG: prepilin-type N-terminal cleavage/methylation domain-containing protein [Clostridia bacterium]|nr:prepilin-type N-terminal cleavage/methylation domain-containing protein [Clostridia bacterium]
MKTMKKKGFTLVELLVVIAIIAILATVSIVGYTTFINKANMSADQQAVEQMNTMLEALDVNNEPEDIIALWAYLNQTGLTAEDYRPLSKGHIFVWDKTLNRVLLVKDEAVVYPDEYKTATKANTWYNLVNQVEAGKAPEVVDGAVAIGSASDLIATIMTITPEVKTMNLSGGADLMGANLFIPEVKDDLTIEGTNNATIANLVSTEYATVGKGSAKDPSSENQQYASGFVGTVKSGETLTIKNVVFDGLTIGDYETGSAGVIVGTLMGNLVLENVTIKNCAVYGQNKVGIIAGQVSGSASITMKNVKIENCTVNSSESEAGKLFGIVSAKTTIAIDDACTWTNVKVNIVAYGNHKFVTINGVQYVTKVDGNGATDTKTIGDKTYTRVCQCPTENTLAWFYPENHNDVALDDTYCGRPAEERTTVAGLNTAP